MTGFFFTITFLYTIVKRRITLRTAQNDGANIQVILTAS